MTTPTAANSQPCEPVGKLYLAIQNRGRHAAIHLWESFTLDANSWKHLVVRLRRKLRDPASAEDLLHSAYLRLEKYRQTREVDNPDAFLIQVAVNLSIDERRRLKWLEAQPFDEACHRFASSEPLQDEVIAARERLASVKTALDQLPERTRMIFLMHRLDGLKYREIAERFGISQSAVEKHIARATLLLVERTEGW